MDRLCFCVVLVALCAVVGDVVPTYAAEEKAPTPILKTNMPVRIDGSLNDPCWRELEPIRADYADGKPGVLGDEKFMNVRYAWDDYYLYIGYETFDTNIVAVGSGKIDGPPTNPREGCEIWKPGVLVDVVEFFITFGDKRFFWEIHHNAANQFNDVLCVVLDEDWPFRQSATSPWGILFNHGEYIQDDGDYRVAIATSLKWPTKTRQSSINYPTDTDSGYTAEIRLPWYGIGAPKSRSTQISTPKTDNPWWRSWRYPGPWKMAGQELRIIAVVQNADAKIRYHHSSPTRKGGWFHKCVSDWPLYKLVVPEPAKK